MPEINQPSQEHVEFDALCAGVEEWEPLPDFAAPASEELTGTRAESSDESPLDGQILAGLVSPA